MSYGILVSSFLSAGLRSEVTVEKRKEHEYIYTDISIIKLNMIINRVGFIKT